jgi:hypothetical protein
MIACLCRNCGIKYAEHKATADWKGYCSQRCFHEMAKKRGYSKSRHQKYGPTFSEYAILDRVKEIGSVKA